MGTTQKQFDHANGNYILDIHGPKKALKKLWNISNFEASAAPLVYEGILYISKSGSFYAMNPETGNIIWEYIIPREATMPVFFENILIFGGKSLDNHVYAIDKNSGQELWKYRTSTENATVQNVPVIFDDSVYLLAGKRIHCLDFRTGKKQWSFDLKKRTGYKNLIITSDRIYAVTDEGYDKQELHCVDNNKQELLWKIKTPNLGSNLLHIEGHLFYLNKDAELVNINLETREIVKSKIVELKFRTHELHLSYYQGIMIIVIGSGIYGLNMMTNPWSWQWTFYAGSDIGKSVLSDNMIYFSSIWNGVYGLDFYTGKQILHIKSDVRSSLVCGVHDAAIFVAGSMNEYELTAYGEGSKQNKFFLK